MMGVPVRAEAFRARARPRVAGHDGLIELFSLELEGGGTPFEVLGQGPELGRIGAVETCHVTASLRGMN